MTVDRWRWRWRFGRRWSGIFFALLAHHRLVFLYKFQLALSRFRLLQISKEGCFYAFVLRGVNGHGEISVTVLRRLYDSATQRATFFLAACCVGGDGKARLRLCKLSQEIHDPYLRRCCYAPSILLPKKAVKFKIEKIASVADDYFFRLHFYDADGSIILRHELPVKTDYCHRSSAHRAGKKMIAKA